MTTQQDTASRYWALLPEIFQESTVSGQPLPVGRLPSIIETVFGDFEGKLDRISDYFHPEKTDPDFLPWMASWVALVLRADWSLNQQRTVLAQILPLYQRRGTKGGLEHYLKIYAGPGVTIPEEPAPLQIAVSSTVGGDTVIGGLPPYFFIVNVAFDEPDPGKLKEKAKAVEAVLQIEKPAHTYYKLNFSGPTFRLGYQSTIGTDTLI